MNFNVIDWPYESVIFVRHLSLSPLSIPRDMSESLSASKLPFRERVLFASCEFDLVEEKTSESEHSSGAV